MRVVPEITSDQLKIDPSYLGREVDHALELMTLELRRTSWHALCIENSWRYRFVPPSLSRRHWMVQYETTSPHQGYDTLRGRVLLLFLGLFWRMASMNLPQGRNLQRLNAFATRPFSTRRVLHLDHDIIRSLCSLSG